MPVFWDLYSVPGMAMLAIGIAAPVVYLLVRAALASQDTALEWRPARPAPRRCGPCVTVTVPLLRPGAAQLRADRLRPVARGAGAAR